MTPVGARFILDLGISARDKKQLLKLLTKQREGTITVEESDELESYVHADNLLSVFKAQATLALKKAGQVP
jgi:hypothetical protein